MTPSSIPTNELAAIRQVARDRLLTWFSRNGRTFWWRNQTDPYQTALVEVLLRQTRADPVEDAMKAFVEKYANPGDLASVDVSELEDDLKVFGLQRQRARQLNALGTEVVRLRGEIPSSLDGLLDLPGIGPYSAAAIRCFAFGECDAVVDVNVARIVGRLFGINVVRGEPRRNKEIIRLSQYLVDGERPQDMNWALLDLGSSICRPQMAQCEQCPISLICSHCLTRQS